MKMHEVIDIDGPVVVDVRACGFCGQRQWERVDGASPDGSHRGVQYACGHCGARGPLCFNGDSALAMVYWNGRQREAPVRVEGTLRVLQKIELSTPIRHIRTGSADLLEDCGIRTVGDLVEKSEVDLLRTPRLGKKRVGEIRKELSTFGLYLAGEGAEGRKCWMCPDA